MSPRTALPRFAYAGLTLLGSGLGISQATTAHAGVVGCRTDPIVTLSSGVTVQLYSDIFDVSTSIQNVSYVLHAPVGTTALSVRYPPDMSAAIPETFQLIADGKDDKYQTTAYVTDADRQVQITTYGIATAPSGAVSKTFKQNGQVNRLIKLDMQVPK